ncbi:MAG: D-glycero-beta-D-manno-heptose 1,7-bisphosphate 7-phosphatase [Chloroflexi bacterium]|nr:D-glycero-beta-D-manno-heptose 1,7-bisphosphate 7-phosphatase [Chloroflexota bacterium]
MGRGAVFIDRDGTINAEVGYLGKIDALALLPGAIKAIQHLSEVGLDVFIVTNQAGVARGYFDEEVIRAIHRKLAEELAQAGAFVRAIYYCPHHPDFPGDGCGTCSCRKPLPGMLFMAAADYGIDLSESFMVGDTVKDIETGRNAGCKSVLVLTGYGKEEKEKLTVRPDFIAEDLLGAAEWIISQDPSKRHLTLL